MLEVSGDLVPTSRAQPGADPGTVVIRIPTRPDELALTAAGERDRVAERRSLAPLFKPDSVAVVGASRREDSIGHQVLRSLIEHGFRGKVYPVNPHTTEVAGLPASPNIAAVPAPLDLAVIAVPRPEVASVVSQCADAGVGAAVVLTAGFAEAAGDGVAEQTRLVRAARSRGLRLLGPNCLGLINTDPRVKLAASFAPRVPPPGELAVASQSGALGIAILDAAAEAGVGISSFVSLGDKADVSTNDLLAYWHDDPATQIIAMYIESLGNPRRFSWLARSLARRKPVLVLKSGRSLGGQRAGASHTAAAAIPDRYVDALFRQAGVLRIDTLRELLAASRVLLAPPVPTGKRVAIVGNAGGLNVLAADAADGSGLEVVKLSTTLQRRLSTLSPHNAGADNPVDLGADATPTALAEAVAAICRSAEVDSVVITYVATRVSHTDEVFAALGSTVDATPAHAIVAVVVGADAPTSLGRRRVPVFKLPEDAVQGLGQATAYAHWRAEPAGVRGELSGIDPHTARTLVRAALDVSPGWQPTEVALRLLAAYGIAMTPTRTAADESDCATAAEELGYPVAVKAAVPSLVHKTDLGAVILGLESAVEVRDAYRAIARAVDLASPPVVVQRMVSDGAELAAGIVHDPLFGSLVSLGAGGTTTDLWDDHAFRLPPVTDADAAAMWRSLKVAPLLTGFRGTPPRDTAALEDVIQRLSRLAEDVPEITELDLNPLMASPSGVAAVDVKLRLSFIGHEPEAYTHALQSRTPRRPASTTPHHDGCLQAKPGTPADGLI
jgi:acyl-CoA synthetase (NDP forming)